MSEIAYRPIAEDEYPAFAKALADGFSVDVPGDDFTDLIRTIHPPERSLGAFDGDEIVGTFSGLAVDLTIPGGSIPMEGTTAVTVFPTHRRMGLMHNLMGLHLENSVENGYAIAGLWASETSIYGRYGYGIATYADTITMVARDIRFRDGIDIDRVTRISVEEALDVLPTVFDEVLVRTPGMYSRSAAWWKLETLHDADWRKRGKTSLRIVVHDSPGGPDGYAIYRHEPGDSGDGHSGKTVHIVEVIAVTERAHASLWSYLTNIDGSPNVRLWNSRIDESLPMKLVEPRRIKVESQFDALWILILDVTAALEARTYEQDGSVRFTVTNAYRTDVEGSYELVIDTGVGSCERVAGDTDISVDLDVLGALYLGGGDTLAYRAAGRVRGDAGTVALMNALFRTAQQPWCNEVF
jgi:predicted acetyltransferase